jgi:putative acetyltransferase
MTFSVKQLERHHMGKAAIVHRASFDDRLPWLAGLHTPDEDDAFFRNVVFKDCEVWGSFDGSELIGFIAFREGHIEQFYVFPEHQSRGMGTDLLAIAKQISRELSLWTFQRNQAARGFYESRGFVAVEHTDGSGNEEREPDVRYLWRA